MTCAEREMTEQEALEQFAVRSRFARWIDRELLLEGGLAIRSE
jgi:hypothetical protein